MAATYDVLLVRHGESEANKLGRFACHSWDPPLTPRGTWQAERLAQQLHGWPIRYLLSSPLARAQMTIAPLAQRLAMAPIVLDGLAEVNLGQWDGQAVRDLESNNPAFRAWRTDPEKNPPPGGESILTVGTRVLRALEAFWRSQAPGLAVAATHADCIKGSVLVVTQATGPIARQLWVPNCGQLLLRYVPSSNRWMILLAPVCPDFGTQ